jgi:DNA polymerase-3 subunit delta'
MRFADVIGHDEAAERFGRAVSAARVPAAILVIGPPGIGKRRLADAFTARLLCAAPVAGDSCGVCTHCTRVTAGTHPDVRVVERDADRRDIRIEQVRELARWLALQPLMAERKVAIVDGAHCLNEHGQNALLKTLEEPPGGSVLVLSTSSAALMLPTVRSRCTHVPLHPLSHGDLVRALEAAGVPADRARQLAPLADGSPGQALAFDGEDAAKARDVVLATLPKLAGLSAAELAALAQELSRRPVEGALATFLAWYRDVLETGLLGAPPAPRNPDAVTAVRAAADRLPVTSVLRQLAAVCDTIDALGRNANRMLGLETMLLSLRDVERGADRP